MSTGRRWKLAPTLALVVSCALGGLASCAAQKAPAPGRGTLHLMPVIDSRGIERDAFVTLTKQIEEAARSVLSEKGYTVVVAPFRPDERVKISNEGNLTELTPEEIVWVGPRDAEKLVVIRLLDVDTSYTPPTRDFRVEVRGMVIDTTTRKALLDEYAAAESNLSGSFTTMSPTAAQYEAVYQSMRKLFKSLS